MHFDFAAARHDRLRAAINAAYRAPESSAVAALLDDARLPDESLVRVRDEAARWIAGLRAERSHSAGIDALMHEFSLDSDEGVALMCLAEALLRTPDARTRDALIRDKIGAGDWRAHLGQSASLFVNAASWGLLVTGKLAGASEVDAAGGYSSEGLGGALMRLVAKGGEPLIRKAVDVAMRMLGDQFVCGETIERALANSATGGKNGARHRDRRIYRYSYDMLGEAALTAGDAARYTALYAHAIDAIGASAGTDASGAGGDLRSRPGVSIKLSALHPRYTRFQRERVMRELYPRLKGLALQAKTVGIGMNVDAEEADRLDLSLDLFEMLAHDADLADWQGLGFVVQAYQKRAPAVVDWLIDLACRTAGVSVAGAAGKPRRTLMVRLVKGAYWDTEIKRAQVEGQTDYPVFTRKAHTDVAYQACARKLLGAAYGIDPPIFPQFATHNAYTVAWLREAARAAGVAENAYEFQCLYGMGEPLYDQVLRDQPRNPGAENRDGGAGTACRIYAPVGTHATLLAYLVRRLLENGANTSFVNRILDESVSVAELTLDPVEKAATDRGAPHPRIPLPPKLYGDARANSLGLDWGNEEALAEAQDALNAFDTTCWDARPMLGYARTQPAADESADGPGRNSAVRVELRNPASRTDLVGCVQKATIEDADRAVAIALAEASGWSTVAAATRAGILKRCAENLEAHRIELAALLIREAGRTFPNAISEIREAADYCRYYASQIERDAEIAPTPTTCHSERSEESRASNGEILRREAPQNDNAEGAGPAEGRYTPGAESLAINDALKPAPAPVVCISPWNFPLAIFTGQVAAALAAGRCVLAKPAEATPLVAARAVELFRDAGVPVGALQLLPGSGSTVGSALTAHPSIGGVLFTGSLEVAKRIQRSLAERKALTDANAAGDGDAGAGTDSKAFDAIGDSATGVAIDPVADSIADPFLVAETGGVNAMIVDSSALTEQVVADVLASAFDSAGQRCSALRVLCVQEEVYATTLKMLCGAMRELAVGDPRALSTDVGPVIDSAAAQKLTAHVDAMRARGFRVTSAARSIDDGSTPADRTYPSAADDSTGSGANGPAGSFVTPTVIEIDRLSDIPGEVFGPILHVLEFRFDELDALIAAIGAAGYGLTMGVHSRIDEHVARIAGRARIGNVYVNRNMIGAVVGVQPFGGERLSGTGPKAGGPLYLAALGGPLGRELDAALPSASQTTEHAAVSAAASSAGDALAGSSARDARRSALPAGHRAERGRKPSNAGFALLDAIAASLAASLAGEPPDAIETSPDRRADVPPKLSTTFSSADRATLLAACDSARGASLAGRTCDLRGPTGERNVLEFDARRRVGCVAGHAEDLAAQIIAAVAAGAIPYAQLLDAPRAVDEALPPALLACAKPLLADTEIDALLIAAPRATRRQWSIALAERYAEIVPVIAWDLHTDPLRHLWRLFHEKCTSTNTAAAGGNTSLVTMAAD